MNELLRVPDRLDAGYVFDLEGTIYPGSELLPGPKRLLQALPGMRHKVVFVSNNPTRASEARGEALGSGCPGAPVGGDQHGRDDDRMAGGQCSRGHDFSGRRGADRPDDVLDRIDRLVPEEHWEELGW